MKKIISKLLLGGAFLCGLSMSLTSCEGALDDILGEWSRPTPGGGSSSDETTPTMMATPLTFEVLTDGTIIVATPLAGMAGMYYKKNGGDQVDLTAGATIDVTKGDKVEFYGTATHYCNTFDDFTAFGGTAEVKVYGNIMSLLSPTGFADNKILSADYTFLNLFKGYANLKDASGLLLPATTLTSACYGQMFDGCTSLTTAPKELPAKSLTDQCYLGMFSGCSSLTTAPEELPAPTLTDWCYYSMFAGCSSLTAAPALPAKSLAERCYYSMFLGCTSLTTVPELPATELKSYCYYEMFNGCSSLTTAPKLPATTLAEKCYSGMFDGCTSLTNAYVKAAYDSDKCNRMFDGCSADGTKTLHTTAANKDSWDGVMGSGKTWSTWTTANDWTD